MLPEASRKPPARFRPSMSASATTSAAGIAAYELKCVLPMKPRPTMPTRRASRAFGAAASRFDVRAPGG
jgi:hypothetical protein